MEGHASSWCCYPCLSSAPTSTDGKSDDVSPLSDATDCLQLVLSDAPHPSSHGSAVCIPPEGMRPPFSVEWRVDGETMSHSSISVDKTGLVASRLPPQCAFEVLVVDCTGARMQAHAKICVRDVPCVHSYVTTPSSSSIARDGSVRAVVYNAPAAARYLWTTGATTDEPVLGFAQAGTYAVTLVGSGEEEGAATTFTHVCCPAVVTVSPDVEAGGETSGG